VLAFVTLCCFGIGFVKNRMIRTGVICILLLVACFDSYRYVSKWIPFEPKEYMYPETGVTEFLAHHVTSERVFGNVGNEVGSTFSLPLIEGYDAMYQGRYAELVNAASEGKLVEGSRSVVQMSKNGTYTDTLLSLLGVKYIVHKESDGRNSWVYPHWLHPETQVSVYKDPTYEVFENKSAFPRVFLASGYELSTGSAATISVLVARSTNLRETVILEKEPDLKPEVGTGSAEIVSYSSNEVVVRTTAQVPKLLLLSDVFDAGWHAVVDGKETPIYRADYDFRAVALSTGSHVVRFYYWPRGFEIALFVSGGALLGMVILFFSKRV
jgi:hypothetical protein